MRYISDINPQWTPCLLTFEGCGNCFWLVRLPVNLPGAPKAVKLDINHPWTAPQVELIYKGHHVKRPEVCVFAQEEQPKNSTDPFRDRLDWMARLGKAGFESSYVD